MSREWNEPPRYKVQIQLPPKEEGAKPRVLTYSCNDRDAAGHFISKHAHQEGATHTLYDNELQEFLPVDLEETEGDV